MSVSWNAAFTPLHADRHMIDDGAVLQEYISTTLPMLVNTLMQLVSTVLHTLVTSSPTGAAAAVNLAKFTVRTGHWAHSIGP